MVFLHGDHWLVVNPEFRGRPRNNWPVGMELDDDGPVVDLSVFIVDSAPALYTWPTLAKKSFAFYLSVVVCTFAI